MFEPRQIAEQLAIVDARHHCRRKDRAPRRRQLIHRAKISEVAWARI
jgi:hypothetical protein